LGATYSWTVFVERLKSLLHRSQAETQLPFTLFYISFPVTLLFSGIILDRLGVRLTVLAGIFVFSMGWILAGLFGNTIWLIALFIGVMGGIGVGISYIVPIKTCQEWFPNHKGLATGISVAGFGGGSALVSQSARYLMQRLYWSPLHVFVVCGIGFLIIGFLGSILLKSPSGKEKESETILPVNTILRDKIFRLLFIGMLAGLVGGFTIIPNLKQIYKEALPLMGATAVSLFALWNAAGRIIWGLIYDRVDGKKIIIMNLVLQAGLILLGAYAIKSPILYYGFAVLSGFNYGGVLVLYAAEGGSIWGAQKLPKLYGWIFFANVPASLSPMLAGWFYDRFGSFRLAFVLISIYMIITALYFYWKYPARTNKLT
jgi:OFA family oxalate/formate antiporter-like MFS transporter